MTLARWQRFRQRPAGERGWIAMLAVALPLLELGLRLLGFVRLKRWIERCSARGGTREATPAELDAASRLADCAAVAGRNGLGSQACLPQSLALYFLLRRDGFGPELRLGVRKPGEGAIAHAWVELQGRELGLGAMGYRPFARLPTAAGARND